MESWLFLDVASKGLEITDWVDIKTFPVPGSNNYDLFKQDTTILGITSYDTLPYFIIELAYPFRASKYKLEIPMNYRFMTGWKLEGSNNNSSFIELDSKDTDLCTTTKSNEACATDCDKFSLGQNPRS